MSHPGKTFGDPGNTGNVTVAHCDAPGRVSVSVHEPQRALLASLTAADARELGELLIQLSGEAEGST